MIDFEERVITKSIEGCTFVNIYAPYGKGYKTKERDKIFMEKLSYSSNQPNAHM